MKYAWIVMCVALLFSSCTCEIPKSMQDKMNKQVDKQIENMACQAQTRLANAFRFPIQELCNGKDDNCDGEIDEGLEKLPCSTQCGQGLMNCVDGKLTQCTTKQPSDEQCNTVDDDCDGETDEQLSRVANKNDCPSKKELCIDGGWICEDHYTITYCEDRGFITAPPPDEPVKSWSYAMHSIESPTEDPDRTFTRVSLTDDGMVFFENIYITNEEYEIEWSFKDSLPVQMLQVIAHAARFGSNILVTLEFVTKQNKSYSEWYLFHSGKMIFRDRQKPTEVLPRILATPLIGSEHSLITYQMEVPGEGGWRVALISEQIPHISPSAVKEITEGMDFMPYQARLYYETPYVVWRTQDGTVKCTVAESDELHTLEATTAEEIVFVECADPRVALIRTFEGSKEINVVAAEKSNELVAIHTIPNDRTHISLAETSNGFAMSSGVPVALSESEYSYITIFIQGFSWEKKLGKSEQPSSRSVTVTQDLGGDTIMVLYDADGIIRAHSFRCQ